MSSTGRNGLTIHMRSRCKAHGIISQAQHTAPRHMDLDAVPKEFDNAMELRVHKELKEEAWLKLASRALQDLLTGLSSEECKKKVQENLMAVTQRTRIVSQAARSAF